MKLMNKNDLQYNKEMEDWNPDADNSTHHFMFKEGDCLTLDIPTDTPLEVDNWRIIPRSTPIKVSC